MAATKTTKKVKNTNIDMVKKSIKEVNGFILETTDEMVDRAIVRGGEWQNLTEKAIKGGLKLADNQQDLFFITLEAFKAQMKVGTKRFKALFSKN